MRMIAFALSFLLPVVLLVAMPLGVFYMLRSWSQTLKWEASFILASAAAFLGYVRIQDILAPPLPIPAFVDWALRFLAIISPACIAAGWSRWQGVTWRLCLVLFAIVPLGVIAIRLAIAFPFAS